MRSWAISRSRSAFSLRCMAAYSKQMAGRKGEIGAIERVEMKLVDTLALQAAAEVTGHGGGDHATSLDVVVEAVEHLGQPRRHLGAAETCHPGDALEVRN